MMALELTVKAELFSWEEVFIKIAKNLLPYLFWSHFTYSNE